MSTGKRLPNGSAEVDAFISRVNNKFSENVLTSFALKMEAWSFSETSVTTYLTTRRHTQEDTNLICIAVTNSNLVTAEHFITILIRPAFYRIFRYLPHNFTSVSFQLPPLEGKKLLLQRIPQSRKVQQVNKRITSGTDTNSIISRM